MSVIGNPLARRKAEQEMREAGRLPPGQSLTLAFPVLHYGGIPRFDPATWSMRVYGLVERELRWSWAEFQALPTVSITTDIHCVTRWSKFDTVWEGVRLRDVMEMAGVKPDARHMIAHCDGGYTTNTPVDILRDDDVLLAYRFDGQPLDPEHGFPVRTLVPSRYFWKSAKWVRALEFVADDHPGFWEQAGYHNNADPWREERMQRRGFF